MKRLTSLLLAVITVLSLAACAGSATDAVSASASDLADEAWLKARLGEVPDSVTVGMADDLGIDMTDFENDGYIIRTSGDTTVVCGKNAEGLDRAVRRYAKYVKYGREVEDVTYHEGYRIKHLTVAGRDISEFTAVYTKTEKPLMARTGRTVGNGEYAAEEFVRLTEKATGVKIPLCTVGEADLTKPYVLFETDETFTEDGECGEYGMNGYEYKVEDGNLIFRGSGISGGCSNGVYTFFERECMWLDLTYGDAELLESEHIDIAADTAYRGEWLFDFMCSYTVFAPCEDFHQENRSAGHLGFYPYACHGLISILTELQYDRATTENPCYSDDYVYEDISTVVENRLKNALAAGQRIGYEITYVDIASPDTPAYCSCKKCAKVYAEEGGYSGAVVRFANRLSEDMNERYPGIKYLFFAYLTTKQPPKKTKGNDLVAVTYCMDGSCAVHPLATGECTTSTDWNGYTNNDDYTKWLEGWCDTCKYVYVWYYGLEPRYVQFTLLPNLYEDIHYLRSMGVKGMMFEDETTGMSLLRFHLAMVKQIDCHPEMTKDEYLETLYRLGEYYYGDGGGELLFEAIRIINESFCRGGCKHCWHGFMEQFNRNGADFVYMGENMEHMISLIDGYIEDAPYNAVESRLKMLEMIFIYEGCAGNYRRASDTGDTAELAYLGEKYELFRKWVYELGFIGSEDEYLRMSADNTIDKEAERWGKYS